MLSFICKINFSVLLISLVFILAGCGGSDTSNQRPANSNPFAPADSGFSSSRQQPPQMSRTRRPTASPTVNKKNHSKKKPTSKETPEPDQITAEISKRTLDSTNPGVAIIVRGVGGNEQKALVILQQIIASSLQNPSVAIQKKQKLPEKQAPKELEHFVFDDQLVLILRPVPPDFSTLAQKLHWGKVSNIDKQNRIITLDTAIQELNALAALEKENPRTAMSPTDNPRSKTDSESPNQSKPTVKTPKTKVKVPEIKGNDRDLKPRAGEKTLDWALRVIAGTSPFAHDTACKKLSSMKPDATQVERVSSVLATTLPLAKDGFRMKEHVNAMAVWYTDEATMAFSNLLAEEKSALVRKNIIELLPKIHSETTAQVIVGRLSNRVDRKHARTAIRIMGQIAEKPVINLLNDPDPSIRIETCKILQYIGGQEALAALALRAETEESSVIKDLISQTQSEIQKKLENPDN